MKEKILIADDSAPNRKILSLLLEKLGFEVIACENGSAAWNALSGEHPNAVAIISGVEMPEMNGIELLKSVRESATHRDLPFVLITGVHEKDRLFEAKLHGIQGCILKPVTFRRVTAKIKELFPSKNFSSFAA